MIDSRRSSVSLGRLVGLDASAAILGSSPSSQGSCKDVSSCELSCLKQEYHSPRRVSNIFSLLQIYWIGGKISLRWENFLLDRWEN